MIEKHLEDILENEKNRLSIDEIYAINDPKLFQKYLRYYKNQLYVLILNTITHEMFTVKQATKLYYEIKKHQEVMNQILKRDVGIVVATLDYLTNIKKTIISPTILDEEKSRSMIQFSTVDGLTDLYARNIFDLFLSKVASEYDRTKKPVSLLFIDIDDFKNVNDTYGHAIGDLVLKTLGSTISQHIREMDLAARYGGEELTIILPTTPLAKAVKLAEKLRKTIQNLSFDTFHITVSIGVTQITDSDTAETFVERADKAMYQAKKMGKNRVVSL